MNNDMDNSAKEIFAVTSKELEYMAENFHAIDAWKLMDRLFEIQGALTVVLSQLHKSLQKEN